MLTPRRSRLFTPLALAATAALVAAPTAGAQSTLEADGTLAVSSLGSTAALPSGSSGSLGSLAPTPYAEYVALGDSYAALGDNQEPADGPPACARSLANYAHVVSGTDARVGDLTDVTCSGAVVDDLTDEQHPGVAPQFDALQLDTDLVTLSIGGNDIGFGTMVGCLLTTPREDDGSPCRDALDAEVSAAIDALGPELDEVYDAIAEDSPNATVVTTQYLPLMPETGGCEFTETISPDDVDWAREKTEQLNNAVAAAATRNGHVSVLPTDEVDRSGCAPADQRWTSFAGEPDHTAIMHPTALGQEAMAGAISDAL